MTPTEAVAFVLAEIARMQATIDNLVERYARPGSELEVHLQHVGNRLDIAAQAVAKKGAAETVHEAAARLGHLGETVRRWLVEARAAGATDIPAPPSQKKAHWRVRTEILERVVAARAEMESTRAAAARVGLDVVTLRKWLMSAGVARPSGRLWMLPRDVVDWVVAERRAKVPMHVVAKKLGMRAEKIAEVLRAHGAVHPRKTKWLLDEAEVRALVERERAERRSA